MFKEDEGGEKGIENGCKSSREKKTKISSIQLKVYSI